MLSIVTHILPARRRRISDRRLDEPLQHWGTARELVIIVLF